MTTYIRYEYYETLPAQEPKLVTTFKTAQEMVVYAATKLGYFSIKAVYVQDGKEYKTFVNRSELETITDLQPIEVKTTSDYTEALTTQKAIASKNPQSIYVIRQSLTSSNWIVYRLPEYAVTA